MSLNSYFFLKINFFLKFRERLLDYKCDAEKKRQELATLRERLIEETRIRCDLNREVARQRSVIQRLSLEIEIITVGSKGIVLIIEWISFKMPPSEYAHSVLSVIYIYRYYLSYLFRFIVVEIE